VVQWEVFGNRDQLKLSVFRVAGSDQQGCEPAASKQHGSPGLNDDLNLIFSRHWTAFQVVVVSYCPTSGRRARRRRSARECMRLAPDLPTPTAAPASVRVFSAQ
jgi:hypothetical protein